jgi:Tetratricopeptide repeat
MGPAVRRALLFEVDQPGGPILRVQFNHPVAYQVAPGTDFESIVISIAGKTPLASCRPVFPSRIGGGWETTVRDDRVQATAPSNRVPTIRPKGRPTGQLTEAELRAVGASMDEVRAAIKKGNFAQAIQLLTKAVNHPENEHSAEAQELLGVAHQKSGQPVEARSEYEDYLRRYPNGEGTERVRQRLDGILTATGEGGEKLRASKAQRGESGTTPRDRTTTWSVSGSASQFYIRDDSFRTLRDPSLPFNPNDDKDDHRVHQNALLSSFDLIAAWSNSEFKSKFRFSGTEEHRFNTNDEIISVAALFFETNIRQLDLMTRLGRQTRNAGGVLGRFDGGLGSQPLACASIPSPDHQWRGGKTSPSRMIVISMASARISARSGVA